MINVNDILYTPLDIAKIEPDDWSIFWQVWEQDARQYVRKKPDSAGNNGLHPGWNGLVWDFQVPGKGPFTMFDVSVKNYKTVFPKWYERLMQFPFRLVRMQMLSNYRAIVPHRDGTVYTDHLPYACDLRTMIVDENSQPTFWVSKTQDHNTEKFYADLPVDTNTFVYCNPKLYHGADYFEKRKIIVTYIFDQLDEIKWHELLIRSATKYKSLCLMTK